MTQPTDWEFVFECVVSYLQSPVWNLPIVTFIEKNCIVFGPDEESQPCHSEIHKNYAALVDELLCNYLKDVGITGDEFVQACEAGSNNGCKQANRSIFELVWAGEDFDLFKKMMSKKNVDLELQVLRMIQQRNGTVPPAFDPESGSSVKKSKSSHHMNEEKLMQEVIKQSQKEYEKEKEKRKEIERMERTLALSKEESERLHELAERELLELERMVSLSLKLEKHKVNENKQEDEGDKKKRKPSPENKTKSTKGSSSSQRHSPQSSKEMPKSDTTQMKQAVVKQKTEKNHKSETSSPKAETSRKASPTQKSQINEKQKLEPKVIKSETSKSPQPTTVQPAPKPSTPKPPASKPSTSKLSASSTAQTPPIRKADLTPSEAANNWLLSAQAETAGAHESYNSSTESKYAEPSMEDKVRRAREHMLQQRERLLQLKQQERAKKFATMEVEHRERPMSSRTARRHLKAENVQATEAEKRAKNEAEQVVKSEAEKQKMLHARRSLLERIKKDVMINEKC